MVVLLDNGHGVDTPGKRSPDGKLREYAWAREMAKKIKTKLEVLHYDCRIIVPEEKDISLQERCKRVNQICKENKNCLLVSIHCNAAANSGWSNARGWSVWIYTEASKKSEVLADSLFNEAKRLKFKIRQEYSNKSFWKRNFYILKHTICPAALTENFFQDNTEDVLYLLSEKGKEEIANMHVRGIINYIKTIQ